MAKKNAGDILTGAWNPSIGCERYSAGCRLCWYLDGIFPWQQRLGNIPATVAKNEFYIFENRMNEDTLRKQKGIVGIIQHGDLFWSGVPDSVIQNVLTIVDNVARSKRVSPKYVLWTKRAQRMVDLLLERYPAGLPSYLAAAVSVENQAAADERLPYLQKLRGTRIIMIEPMIGPITLKKYLPMEWVVIGSETGKDATPINLDWVADIRDEVKAHHIPLFIKQLGMSHTSSLRSIDGQEWSEFPNGFLK